MFRFFSKPLLRSLTSFGAFPPHIDALPKNQGRWHRISSTAPRSRCDRRTCEMETTDKQQLYLVGGCCTSHPPKKYQHISYNILLQHACVYILYYIFCWLYYFICYKSIFYCIALCHIISCYSYIYYIHMYVHIEIVETLRVTGFFAFSHSDIGQAAIISTCQAGLTTFNVN